jgi:hypothetical protein
VKGPTDRPVIVTCPEVREPLVGSITMLPPSVQPGQAPAPPETNVAETSNVVSAFAAPIPRARAHPATAALRLGSISCRPPHSTNRHRHRAASAPPNDATAVPQNLCC